MRRHLCMYPCVERKLSPHWLPSVTEICPLSEADGQSSHPRSQRSSGNAAGCSHRLATVGGMVKGWKRQKLEDHEEKEEAGVESYGRKTRQRAGCEREVR